MFKPETEADKSEFQHKISAISLEDFITKTLEICPDEDKAPFEYFKNRYIPKCKAAPI